MYIQHELTRDTLFSLVKTRGLEIIMGLQLRSILLLLLLLLHIYGFGVSGELVIL